MSSPTASVPPSRPYRYGICGWDYADWRGPIYPERAPRGFRGLQLLSRFTDFMEVNATFYHPMGGDRAHRWLDETPDNFTFVVKAFRGWTHDGEDPSGPALTAFREIIDPMLERGRLEGVLAQYPPSLRVRNGRRPNLRGIEQLARALAPAPLFVEVRDQSLYEGAFFRFLEERGLGFVNVDLPRVGTLPTLSTINTGPVGYTRLHGRSISGWRNPRATRDERYDHLYDSAELDAITDSLVTLAARVPKLLIAANNHFRAQAPAAVVALRCRLEPGPVFAPSRLLGAYPSLREAENVRPLPDGEDSAAPGTLTTEDLW